MDKQKINNIMFWIIIVFHTFINIFLLFSPYISDNIYYLQTVLFGYILYFLANMYLGHCIITQFEHDLRPDLVPSKYHSYTQNLLAYFIGKYPANLLFTFIPIINISIILYKIWNHYNTSYKSEYNNQFDTEKNIYEKAIDDKIWML